MVDITGSSVTTIHLVLVSDQDLVTVTYYFDCWMQKCYNSENYIIISLREKQKMLHLKIWTLFNIKLGRELFVGTGIDLHVLQPNQG